MSWSACCYAAISLTVLFSFDMVELNGKIDDAQTTKVQNIRKRMKYHLFVKVY